VAEARDYDSEHPNISRALDMEEPIIHLKGSGSDILQTSLKVQVQRYIEFTVSWLQLDGRMDEC